MALTPVGKTHLVGRFIAIIAALWERPLGFRILK
jgi:hypothetical protein